MSSVSGAASLNSFGTRSSSSVLEIAPIVLRCPDSLFNKPVDKARCVGCSLTSLRALLVVAVKRKIRWADPGS